MSKYTLLTFGVFVSTALGTIFIGKQIELVCGPGNINCWNSVEYFIIPLFFLSVSCTLLTGVLLFVNQKIFRTWFKFLLPFIIFFLLLTSLAPLECVDALNLCLDKELVSLLLAVAWFLFSLILIIYKVFRLRRENP